MGTTNRNTYTGSFIYSNYMVCLDENHDSFPLVILGDDSVALNLINSIFKTKNVLFVLSLSTVFKYIFLFSLTNRKRTL